MEMRRSLMRRPNLSVRSTLVRSSLLALGSIAPFRLHLAGWGFDSCIPVRQALAQRQKAGHSFRSDDESKCAGKRRNDAETVPQRSRFLSKHGRHGRFPPHPRSRNLRDTAAATLSMPLGCGGRKHFHNYRCSTKSMDTLQFGSARRRLQPPKQTTFHRLAPSSSHKAVVQPLPIHRPK